MSESRGKGFHEYRLFQINTKASLLLCSHHSYIIIFKFFLALFTAGQMGKQELHDLRKNNVPSQGLTPDAFLVLFKNAISDLTKCESFIKLIVSKNTSDISCTPFFSFSNFLQLLKVENFAS